MEKKRFMDDQISESDMRMWRCPGWVRDKHRLHPIGEYYVNPGLNAWAYVVHCDGEVITLRIGSIHK